MNNTTFTIVMHAGDQLLTVPEEHFTPTQRSAIRFILSRIGHDPIPPTDLDPQTSIVVGTPAPAAMDPAATFVARRAESKAKGYTGDACSRCHMFTMKVSGHCLACDSCGETTGCS